MRIVLLLAFTGCMTSEPVREGRAHVELDTTARGTATYRVVSGSNDSACAHGEHFTPNTGADVQFGPSGGAHVRLAETTTPGTYTASAPVEYSGGAFQFTVDGELFELAAPPMFSATVTAMSASRAMIELSDASVPSDIVIHMPDGKSVARTLVGSPATIEADFSMRGEYRVELLRITESDVGSVEIQRDTTLSVP